MSKTHTSEEEPRRVASDDLVGVAEIAQMAGVSTAAVANWRSRRLGFPEPIAELRAGPVFSASAVRRWLHSKRKASMSNRMATINLKGGVGKTTTTCAFVEILAVEHEKKVLVIDLDPQTNLTAVLIGDNRWKELNEAGQTLAQLFKDSLVEDVNEHVFDLEQALQRGVGAVSDVARTGRLDLLPSSLDLIDVQDRLAHMPVGRFYSRSPIETLHTALKQVLDDYDWVVIDCPPNLGVITLNGLRISQGYVIPTIPDVLSTYGIPQIVERVERFSREINEPIEPYGIIISKFRETNLHNAIVDDLRGNPDLPLVFDTIIGEHVQIAQAAEHKQMGTLRQKWGYGEDMYDAFSALTQEIVGTVEGAHVR